MFNEMRSRTLVLERISLNMVPFSPMACSVEEPSKDHIGCLEGSEPAGTGFCRTLVLERISLNMVPFSPVASFPSNQMYSHFCAFVEARAGSGPRAARPAGAARPRRPAILL